MTTLAQLSAQATATDFDSIPIIDMTNARAPEFEKRKEVAMAIRDACLNVGFFYVKNHGVDLSTVDATFAQSKTFFDLAEEIKRSIDISKSDNHRGYMALLTENNDSKNKGDYHEAFNLGLDPIISPESFSVENASKLKHSENQWPSPEVWAGADEFKKVVLQYYREVLALGQSLFPLIAIALDLPESFFDDKTKHPAAIMRLLFYPGREDHEVDELMPGIGAHTDFECFTILRQDSIPALQVQNHKGDWVDATCIPNTFVINIGDQLMRWTNDIFVSTRHRVLPTLKSDRYSIPFFFGCDHDVIMEPIPTCVSADRPNRYEVMSAGDYVHMRLSEIYAQGMKKEVKA